MGFSVTKTIISVLHAYGRWVQHARLGRELIAMIRGAEPVRHPPLQGNTPARDTMECPGGVMRKVELSCGPTQIVAIAALSLSKRTGICHPASSRSSGSHCPEPGPSAMVQPPTRRVAGRRLPRRVGGKHHGRPVHPVPCRRPKEQRVAKSCIDAKVLATRKTSGIADI